MATDDVKLADRFFRGVLDFYATERVQTSLDDDCELIVHLGMTGVLRPRDASAPDDPYVRARLDLAPDTPVVAIVATAVAVVVGLMLPLLVVMGA